MDVRNPDSIEQDVSVALGEDYPELRDAVRRICSDFPPEYWRKLDEEAAIRRNSYRR